jgi:hypothetical protein
MLIAARSSNRALQQGRSFDMLRFSDPKTPEGFARLSRALEPILDEWPGPLCRLPIARRSTERWARARLAFSNRERLFMLDVRNISEWEFARTEFWTAPESEPNRLAYDSESATLALVVELVPENGLFAISDGGVTHILAALAKGHRIDGKPVREAVVIQVERGPTGYRTITHQPAAKIAEILKLGVPQPCVGPMLRASLHFEEVVPAELEEWA